jgi:hypothetical protein
VVSHQSPELFAGVLGNSLAALPYSGVPVRAALDSCSTTPHVRSGHPETMKRDLGFVGAASSRDELFVRVATPVLSAVRLFQLKSDPFKVFLYDCFSSREAERRGFEGSEPAAPEMPPPFWCPENQISRTEILRQVSKSKSYLEKSKSYDVGKECRIYFISSNLLN